MGQRSEKRLMWRHNLFYRENISKEGPTKKQIRGEKKRVCVVEESKEWMMSERALGHASCCCCC